MNETKAIKLHSKATTMRCLVGKLEIISLDPDPKTTDDLAKEYYCVDCHDIEFCDKLLRFIGNY